MEVGRQNIYEEKFFVDDFAINSLPYDVFDAECLLNKYVKKMSYLTIVNIIIIVLPI